MAFILQCAKGLFCKTPPYVPDFVQQYLRKIWNSGNPDHGVYPDVKSWANLESIDLLAAYQILDHIE